MFLIRPVAKGNSDAQKRWRGSHGSGHGPKFPRGSPLARRLILLCPGLRVAVLRGRTRLENWRPRGQASPAQSHLDSRPNTRVIPTGNCAQWLLLADPPSWPLRTENCPPHRVVLKIQHTDGKRCRESYKGTMQYSCLQPPLGLAGLPPSQRF